MLLKIVKQTIGDHRMIIPGEKVLVAVSGGPDSMALFRILERIATEMDLTLGIAHVNHSIRKKEADEAESFVREISAAAEIPLHSIKTDIPASARLENLSLEEAGRNARYGYFEKLCREYGYLKVATGHHLDDTAELVLMNLIRGSGPLGLAGIAPVRGNIVRPLIRIGRNEIRRFVSENKICFVTDSSNEDTAFLRNRIRHLVLPEIRKNCNPQVSSTLARTAHIIRSEEEWIESLLEPVYEQMIKKKEPGRLIFHPDRILKLHRAAQRRIVRKGIEQIRGNLRRISLRHIESVIRMIENPSSGKKIILPDGIRISKTADTIEIKHCDMDGKADFPDYEHEVQAPGVLIIPETGDLLRFEVLASGSGWRVSDENTAFMDHDQAPFPVVVRNFRPGDRFRPLGMKGTRKLKKFFADKKIPGKERIRCPVLTSGGKILWVAGYRMDDSVKVTEKTRIILKVERLLPDEDS